MATAVNVGFCAYLNNYATGEIVSREPAEDWKTSGYLYAGCDPKYNQSRVIVIRFTLEKFAKTVEIPLQSAAANGSSATKPLCYGLGNDPETDGSMTNASGDANALGTFFFTGAYNTQTITLHNVPAGTRYLYIWGLRPSDYTFTGIYVKDNTVIYEELEAAQYIGNGAKVEPYQAYIFNGAQADLYQAYIGNGSTWDICT